MSLLCGLFVLVLLGSSAYILRYGFRRRHQRPPRQEVQVVWIDITLPEPTYLAFSLLLTAWMYQQTQDARWRAVFSAEELQALSTRRKKWWHTWHSH